MTSCKKYALTRIRVMDDVKLLLLNGWLGLALYVHACWSRVEK